MSSISLTNAARTGDRTRLASVDGLRGLAACMVLLFHVYLNADQPQLGMLSPTLRCLNSGVDLFFVLSGFCLFYPYARSDSSFDWRTFLRRRARRVLPAYYAMICLTIFLPFVVAPVATWLGLVVAAPNWPSWQQVWTHFLMVHTLFRATILGLDSPMWSLGVETQFYLAFPLAIWLVGRFRWHGLAVIAVASVLYRLEVMAVAHTQATGRFLDVSNLTLRVNVDFFLGHWLEFGCGMLVALLVRQRATRTIIVPYQLLLLICATCLYLFAQAYLVGAIDHWLLPISDVLYGAAFSITLLLACTRGSIAARIFAHPLFVWLGTISYSLYLTHLLVLQSLKPTILTLHYTGLRMLLVTGLLGIPVSLACAALFFCIFERPFLNPRAVASHDNATNQLVRVASKLPAP